MKRVVVNAVSQPPHKQPRPGPDPNQLWVDKYAPKTVREVVGQQAIVQKLGQWLTTSSQQKRTHYAALLSGPPGIGKTTMAFAMARETGFEILSMNASDTRNKASIEQSLNSFADGDTAATTTTTKKKRVVIMDEVDAMDRGGNQALIQFIKRKTIPVICICNERSKDSVRSLANSCLDLRVTRPNKTSVARRLQQICQYEGVYADSRALETLVESCGNDVRQCLNTLQLWRSTSVRLEDISKDKMLRINPFEATRTMIAEVHTTTFDERYNSVFVDYNLVPLMIQQNYIKALRSDEEHTLDRLAQASEAASDSELVAHMVSGGDQHWELLPDQAAMNVRVGYLARGGGIGQQPEFPMWLGKHSSKTRKQRLSNEISAQIPQHNGEAVRLQYVPVLRDILLSKLLAGDNAGVIQTLDTYGLTKDDFIENMKELQVGPVNAYEQVSSKAKAALTRAYNKTAHKRVRIKAPPPSSSKTKDEAEESDET